MKTLIIGAGRSGLGVARLLSKEAMALTLVNEIEFEGIDELLSLGIKVEIKSFLDVSLADYDLVIKAPGVHGFPEAINEIEIASKIAKDYQLYAISGTNGKTTAINLLHSMLLKADSKSLALGNVGYSMAQAIVDHGVSVRKIALEVSSFQLEGLKDTKFEAYGILNLSPDHLDRYPSKEAYYQSKLHMLEQSKYKVINIDDVELATRMDKDLDYISLSIKKEADVYLKDDQVFFKDKFLFKTKDLKVPGQHNLINAMFAATLACLAGVSADQIQEALHEFNGVEHRLEFVGQHKGVRYFNDSKATNPEATEVCLKSFDENILLLAGGIDKKVSFDILGKYEDKLKNVYLFGESAPLLQEVFPKAKMFTTMLEALEQANLDASAGDVVVLSPACASFDQFKNFEERGQIFKNQIKTL